MHIFGFGETAAAVHRNPARSDPLKIQFENNESRSWRLRSIRIAAPPTHLQGAIALLRRSAPPGAPVPSGSGATDFAERRNKAIAPYGPISFSGRPEIAAHCASFNFPKALICTVASSDRLAVKPEC